MFTGRGASVAGAHAGAVEAVDLAVSLAEAMERLGRHVEPPAYLNQGCTFAQQGSHRVAPFVQQPLFHAAALAAPERQPSARRAARASFVRIEIRLRSISATSPKAKQSTLLLMLSSKA